MSLRSLFAVLGALFLLATSASAASAADRYLAVDGVDAGDCTDADAPCLTWPKVYGVAAAGDTIHLAAGDYTLANFPDSATVNKANLTISGPQAGVAAPGRSGPEATLRYRRDESGLSNALFDFAAPGIVVDGLSFVNPSTGQAGIGLIGGPGTTLRNSRFEAVGVGVLQSSQAVTIERSLFVGSAPAVVLNPFAGPAVLTDNTFDNTGTSDASVHVNDITMYGGVPVDLTATGNTFTGTAPAFWFYDPGTAQLHANRFAPSTSGPAVESFPGGATVDATENYWGCNGGPGVDGCSPAPTGAVDTSPWLRFETIAVGPTPSGGGDLTVQTGLRPSDGSAPSTPIAPFAIQWSTTLGTVSPTSAVLGSDGTTTAVVQTPAEGGSGTVTATMDGATAPYDVTIYPPSGQPTADPTSVDFGDVLVGGSHTRGITIANDGDADLQLSGVQLTGAGAGSFRVVGNSCTGLTLSPGQSCSVDARARPQAVGPVSATLRVTGDGRPATLDVPLSATGVLAGATASPMAVDFGDVHFGTLSDAENVTVENTGGAPITFTRAVLAGPAKSSFRVDAGNCLSAPSLSPGATCVVRVRARPVAGGDVTAELQITTTAATDPIVVGLAAHGLAPAVTASPDPVDFGDVLVDTLSGPRTATITNSGDAPLKISAASLAAISPDGQKSFRVDASGCIAAGEIAPGGTCDVVVRTRPRQTGAASASVVLKTNTPSGSASFTLKVRGIAAGLAYYGGPVDFGDQPTDTLSAPRQIIIFSTGDVPLRITSAMYTSGGASFRVSATDCTSRAVRDYCAIQLRTRPKTTGPASGTLTLVSNAQNSPYDISVSVNGV